jgi:hypothetical protein
MPWFRFFSSIPAQQTAFARIPVALRFVSLALLTSSALIPLQAQFQTPTPDELNMTSDPKAPGADAVYLNVSETADRRDNIETYYARIKVLTENGKDLATIDLPYEKNVYSVANIKARTIQPDGTIIPLEGKPTDILKAKTKGYQAGRKVFTLPRVQVGSILEYYFQLRYTDNHPPHPYWQIQLPYFVHKAQYKCISCQKLQDFSVLPPGVSLSKDRSGQHIELDLDDIPPAPDEEWMPPLDDLLYKVVFYTPLFPGPTFWSFNGGSWSASVNAFVDPSSSFRATIQTLIQPSDTVLVKAKKLYKVVQSIENTDYTREKTDVERKQLRLQEVHRAEDVWTQKAGLAQRSLCFTSPCCAPPASPHMPCALLIVHTGSSFTISMISTSLTTPLSSLNSTAIPSFSTPAKKCAPFKLSAGGTP